MLERRIGLPPEWSRTDLVVRRRTLLVERQPFPARRWVVVGYFVARPNPLGNLLKGGIAAGQLISQDMHAMGHPDGFAVGEQHAVDYEPAIDIALLMPP